MCKRIKRGQKITAENLAKDVINEVGPGGEYLTQMHTFKHFKQELYAPILEERDNFDMWTSKGGLTMEQRANTRYKEILENYKEPAMDKSVRKDLDAYISSIEHT